MTILCWNINGISDKLGDQELVNVIKNHDILVFLETLKDKNYSVNIPGYISNHFAYGKRSKNAKRASGGMLVLIKDIYKNHISVDMVSEISVWLKISKVTRKTHKDFCKFCIYPSKK